MKVRVSTFNLENLDDVEGSSSSLQERIEILQPQIERLNADIICAHTQKFKAELMLERYSLY